MGHYLRSGHTGEPYRKWHLQADGPRAMHLTHRIPECTGHWELRTRQGRFCWICIQCHVVRDDTMDNQDAAHVENLMGRRLARLTEEGRKLLNSGGTAP